MCTQAPGARVAQREQDVSDKPYLSSSSFQQYLHSKLRCSKRKAADGKLKTDISSCKQAELYGGGPA